MSKRKSKAITLGKSEFKCKFCKGEMVVRKHPEITKKLKSQVYYFSQWDYCKRCKKVYFSENNKVLTSRGSDWEETQRQNTFLKEI